MAVCGTQEKDPVSGKYHCDKEKLSQPITPFIFLSNCQVLETSNHPYFLAYSDGLIVPKLRISEALESQVNAFINITNLNHLTLKNHRVKDVLNPILEVLHTIEQNKKRLFMKAQFERILSNPKQPFRQFLLIYFASKLGIN